MMLLLECPSHCRIICIWTSCGLHWQFLTISRILQRWLVGCCNKSDQTAKQRSRHWHFTGILTSVRIPVSSNRQRIRLWPIDVYPGFAPIDLTTNHSLYSHTQQHARYAISQTGVYERKIGHHEDRNLGHKVDIGKWKWTTHQKNAAHIHDSQRDCGGVTWQCWMITDWESDRWEIEIKWDNQVSSGSQTW